MRLEPGGAILDVRIPVEWAQHADQPPRSIAFYGDWFSKVTVPLSPPLSPSRGRTGPGVGQHAHIARSRAKIKTRGDGPADVYSRIYARIPGALVPRDRNE